MYEVVYTYEWYDGPRRGIAHYRGTPHVFESEWRDAENLAADSFLLSPINSETFTLALEDWAIWRRWETAFHQGTATRETHPALPADRARHEELQRLLHGRLAIDPATCFRQAAEFRRRDDAMWNGIGWGPLEVCWHNIHSNHT